MPEPYAISLELVVNTYKTLQKLNPEHSLLNIITPDDLTRGFSHGAEFEKKYPCEYSNLRSRIGAFIRYEQDLRKAISDELRKQLELS